MLKKILKYFFFIKKLKIEFKIKKKTFLLIGYINDTFLFKQYLSNKTKKYNIMIYNKCIRRIIEH